MKSSLLLTGALGALALCVSTAAMAAPATTPAPPPAGAPAPGGPRMGPGMMGPGGPGMMGPGMMGHGQWGRMGRGRRGMGMMGGPRATTAELAKRRADMFARIDANKDGKVTEGEFHAFIEARKREREHRMFQRFSGGQDAVTLDQLNAKALERERAMEGRRGGGRGPGGPGGPRGPGGPPPAR